jgi:hypothetical protein
MPPHTVVLSFGSMLIRTLLLPFPCPVSSPSGIYAVHRFIQVLRKMIQEADEHWKAQIKTLEHEGVKVDRMARDNMMRTQLAWSAWQRAQISIAHKHISVNAAITLHALVPLLEFHTSALLKKKELDRDFQQREKECHAAKIALQKELAACEKLIDVWKQLHAEETGGSGAASSAGGSGGGYSSAGPLGAAMASHRSSTFTSGSLGGSGRNLLAGFGGGSRGEDSFGGGGGSGEPRQSIFSKLTRAVSTLSYSSPAAVQEKLVTATIKYQEVLTSTNRRLEIFHTHELPHYLLELQQLELQRLELTEASLRSHAQLTEERERELVNQFYSTSLPDNVATMDPAADLDECISQYCGRNWLVALAACSVAHADSRSRCSLSSADTYIDSHGFAPVYSSIPYALPVSLDEIKSGRILGNPNSVFHSTLQHLMDVQKDTHPSLPVPRFLLYTLDAIRSCNGGRGIEQEGIFRISPSKDEMEGVKRALNAVGIAGMQKSDIPTQSVYLTCALLKEWLRSLVDSCIPTKDYNACITIVKKTLAAEDAAAASAAASPPPSSNSGRSLQLPMSGGKAGEGKRGSFIASNSATSSQLASLVSSLPLVNQRVLQLLADFVDEVVEEKNQKSNRMTVDNLRSGAEGCGRSWPGRMCTRLTCFFCLPPPASCSLRASSVRPARIRWSFSRIRSTRSSSSSCCFAPWRAHRPARPCVSRSCRRASTTRRRSSLAREHPSSGRPAIQMHEDVP